MVHHGVLALLCSLAQVSAAQAARQPGYTLADDTRLHLATSLRRPSVLITDAVQSLAEEAEVELKVTPEGNSGTPRFGLAFSETRLDRALSAIAEFTGWMWERRDGVWVLRPRRSPAAWEALNRLLIPQTPAARLANERGLGFVRATRNLPQAARAALSVSVDQGGGIAVMDLPADAQNMLGDALSAMLSERPVRGLPSPYEEWRAGRVSVAAHKIDSTNLYQITVRPPRGSFTFAANDYQPGPPPPDETLRKPEEVAREKEERRRLLNADSRMAKRVSLRKDNATLGEALVLYTDRTGIGWVADRAEVRDDRHDVRIAEATAREVLERLRRTYGFDWDMTPGGVLVIRAADFHPDLLARKQAIRDLVGMLKALPPDTQKALAREEGLAFSDLPADMQRAARVLITQDRGLTMTEDEMARCRMRIYTSERSGRAALHFGGRYDTGHGTRSWETGYEVAGP